jgi:two-component system, OmpR family, alkaline phosphatase synthesis response regulator PhoP
VKGAQPGPARGPVLVVDDDQDIREIVEIALTSHGYRVITARDGHDCLRQARGVERPSIILLDLMMPDMNGWAVCEELMKDPELSDVAVVILTGNADVREERVGKYPVVKKPIELKHLLELIERHARER